MNEENELSAWYKFRVIAFLRPGALKVKPIAPPAPPGTVILFDLFIDEIPIDLVPASHRIPNSDIWCLVEGDQTVSRVSVERPESVSDEYS
jgi:hypothetical protein